MVSTATILCICISLVICLLLPIVIMVLLTAKFHKQGIVSAWLLGAAGFFVTQILIRLPILAGLSSQSWFLSFSQSHLFAYVFCLDFTAGLFELAGRFCVAKILVRKNLPFRRSLAAGLGHGGIEAMVITGIAMVNNLAYAAMINSGTFGSILAQSASAGVDVSQLEMISQQLISYPAPMFLLGAFERILAMTAHAAMSMLVCYGVAHKKILPCTMVCLGIHTFIDLTAGLTLILPQTTAYLIVYTILTAVAVFSLYVIRELHRRWHNMEEYHESE